MIEEAKTGRAGCRSCREKIGKGELRFGVVDYSFSSDGSFKWHHLQCAAKKIPAALAEAIEAHAGVELPDKEALLQACAEGRKGTGIPRVEPAPSGRAKCLICEEKIAKAELRVVVEREVEGVGQPRPGYLHVACAVGSEHLAEVEDLPATIRANSDLPEETLAELDKTLAG